MRRLLPEVYPTRSAGHLVCDAASFMSARPLNVEHLPVAGMSNESHDNLFWCTRSDAGAITMNSSWYCYTWCVFFVKRNSLGRRIPGFSLVAGVVVGTRGERLAAKACVTRRVHPAAVVIGVLLSINSRFRVAPQAATVVLYCVVSPRALVLLDVASASREG